MNDIKIHGNTGTKKPWAGRKKDPSAATHVPRLEFHTTMRDSFTDEAKRLKLSKRELFDKMFINHLKTEARKYRPKAL